METQSAKQRIIKDITNDDVRIQVTGYIKKIVEKDYIILNDKTGNIKVTIKSVEFNFKLNDLVNAIGDLDIGMDGGKVIHAQIVQDMRKLNFQYYMKIYELKKELD